MCLSRLDTVSSIEDLKRLMLNNDEKEKRTNLQIPAVRTSGFLFLVRVSGTEISNGVGGASDQG